MDPEYLRSCSHGMVEAIKEGDPDCVWLMETWVFINGYIWKDENILDFWNEIPSRQAWRRSWAALRTWRTRLCWI